MWIDIAAGYVVGELVLGGIAVVCGLVLFVLAGLGDKVRGQKKWQGKRNRI